MSKIEELLAQVKAMGEQQQQLVTQLAALQGEGATGEEGDEKDEELDARIRELAGKDDAVEELGRIAQKRAKEFARIELRKKHVVEFASRVTGGTDEVPVGLPIRAADLVRLLLRLPEPEEKAVETLLEKVWAGTVVNFEERGYDSPNYNRRELPVEYRELMKEWVASGHTAESFFDVNKEVGQAGDFNLTAYRPVKDGE